MTLTELKYVVALAQFCHFGKAAEHCHVSQPTLSVAINKVEGRLGIHLFERHPQKVTVTDMGLVIVAQAKRALEEADKITDIVQEGKSHLTTPLRIGAIYSVGPHLYPLLIPQLRALAPTMPLVIQEDYTHNLKRKLQQGELDVVFIALPFSDTGLVTKKVYTEPFVCLMASDHPLAKEKAISPEQLQKEHVILPGIQHCLRDQIVQICPECYGEPVSGVKVEGTSLITIKHMVSSGINMTILPSSAIEAKTLDKCLAVRPIKGVTPARDVAIAWRSSFPRTKAIDVLIKSLHACELEGVCLVPQ